MLWGSNPDVEPGRTDRQNGSTARGVDGVTMTGNTRPTAGRATGGLSRRRYLQLSALVGTVATVGVGTASGSPLAEIEFRTDEYGVTHVEADSLYALGYGNGYTQARDRLFQMDLLRLVGRGESAEWLGPAQLPSDIEVRRDLYDREEINRQWDRADETTREAVRGFCDGVNRRIVERAAEGELPAEFVALGRAPEPWKPEDTVAVINYTLGFFGVGGGAELSNARTLAELFESLGDEREAWEAYGDLNRVVVPDDHYGSVRPDEIETTDERALSYDEVSEAQLEAVRAAAGAEAWGIENLDLPAAVTDGLREAVGVLEGFRFGSNAVIVDGDCTETGKPMLGGGPQMGLFKPPVIHEIGLHGAGFDVRGVGVVGTPSIVVGRTPELAWTVTTSGDDMVDTVAVELDPEDRYRYKWNGEWHTMSTETVTHYTSPVGAVVQGDDAEDVRVVRQEVARVEQEGTRMPVIALNPEENVAYCQRVTTRMEELDGAFMWAQVGRADTIDEFESSLAEFPFGFNFHVIDDEGIAYFRTGTLPDRRGGRDPRLPTPPSEHEWNGFDVGTNIGASVRDPERGYVVNWNNAPAPGWHSGDSEQQWGTVHRVDVMKRLMQEALGRTDGALSQADVEGIVEDCSVEHPFAPRSTPAMADAVRDASDPQLDAMVSELVEWFRTDYSFRPGPDGRYENGGMAIWEEVRKELQELVFRDKLGDQTPELNFDPTATDGQGGGDPHAADHGATVNKDVTLVDAIDGETTFRWFDRIAGENHPSRTRQRDAIIREAMRRAAETLEERFDSANPADWRLEARESEFTPLGAANPDRIPMTNRASFQQSIAIGEGPDASKSVLPPGNSGHQNLAELPGTLTGDEPDRLTDQLELYANFAYKPHPVTDEGIDRETVSTGQTVTTNEEIAEATRPVTDLTIALLSIPGGGIRAVRDVPRTANRSLNALIDSLDSQTADALNAPGTPPSAVDGLKADLAPTEVKLIEALEADEEVPDDLLGGVVDALTGY